MKYIAEYPLKPDGVSKSLIFIEDTLGKYRLRKHDLMEALLMSEETLLMLEEAAPEDAVINVEDGTTAKTAEKVAETAIAVENAAANATESVIQDSQNTSEAK